MSESKHTPGEWTPWLAPSGEWTVRAVYRDEKDRRCTAFVSICNAGAQDNEANARLIAAAPDMFEALVALRASILRFPGSLHDPAMNKAERALARATDTGRVGE